MISIGIESGDPRRWDANPGPQYKFLSSPTYEGLYGGAAGGGKSDALLMGPLRCVHYPLFRALILRRTFPELQRSLMERAHRWYTIIGARKTEGGKIWRFPSGAVIEFGHLEHEADVYNYQSAEYQHIAFDELTHFTESQYTYMLSRLRRSDPAIPLRVRSGTNPGGEGHEWVKRRWRMWLDEEYKGYKLDSGVPFYYTLDDAGNEIPCARDTPGVLSRVFVQARVTDNPKIMEADPGYVMRLKALPPVERKRLLDGEWKLFEDPGALWRRSWFQVGRRHEPPELRRVGIYIDPAGSAKKTADEAGIVAAGIGDCTCLGKPDVHMFGLEDRSGRYAPRVMMEHGIELYIKWGADRLVGEDNFGGQIVADLAALVVEDQGFIARMLDIYGSCPQHFGGWRESCAACVRASAKVPRSVNYKAVHASRGKMIRAEPVAAVYHQGRAHHVGIFPQLEDQCCTWNPITSSESPGRLDAIVWAGTDLMLTHPVTLGEGPIVEGTRRADSVPDDDQDDEEDQARW